MSDCKLQDKKKVEMSGIQGIYFDGRRDVTRAIVPDVNGNLHPRMIKEEHVSVTVEPAGSYLTHFTPDPPVHPEKPAFKEAQAVFSVLEDLGATQSCIVLGGDSTNSNTGWKGGAMAHVEKLLGHKCQWVVCNVHTLELLLKHLITGLDGPTTSKDGFQGPVCKLLSSVEQMEFNPDFELINGGEDLILKPDHILQNMSTDAKVSYKLCLSVKSGALTEELQNILPGPLSHARWLTTGERLIFLWTRKHNLRGKELRTLRMLVTFCIQFYFKLYFDIKVKHNLTDAPFHILTTLRLLRKQPKKVQDILTFYVRKSAWYAHHENLLLSLLVSQEKNDRIFAVSQILGLRNGLDTGDMSVRPRKTPIINMLAKDLKSLVSWESEKVYEPVFTCSLSIEDIKNFVDSPLRPPEFSSHTQSTERVVKQVTEAASAVVGQAARDGYIRAKAKNREIVTVFKSKQDILEIFNV